MKTKPSEQDPELKRLLVKLKEACKELQDGLDIVVLRRSDDPVGIRRHKHAQSVLRNLELYHSKYTDSRGDLQDKLDIDILIKCAWATKSLYEYEGKNDKDNDYKEAFEKFNNTILQKEQETFKASTGVQNIFKGVGVALIVGVVLIGAITASTVTMGAFAAILIAAAAYMYKNTPNLNKSMTTLGKDYGIEMTVEQRRDSLFTVRGQSFDSDVDSSSSVDSRSSADYASVEEWDDFDEDERNSESSRPSNR